MSNPLVAFEFDLWDSSNATPRTLRLCSEGPLVIGSGASRDQFLPRLKLPVLIGSRISAESYEPPFREVPNGGSVQFAMDEDILPWLDYDHVGRNVRGYAGSVGSRFEDLTLVFNGRIASPGITHDTITANIPLTDARTDLDDVIQPKLYSDSYPEAIRGRPMPEMLGTCYCVEPTLEDEPNQRWRLTTTVPLDRIMNLWVGGIPWRYTSGVPKQGQWTAFLSEGSFELGSSPNGSEVRVDARAVGYDTLTTAQLMMQLTAQAGKPVDADAINALAYAAPGLIGWRTKTEPVNRLDAYDRIMASIVGWWGLRPTGELTAGVIQAPLATADRSASQVTINSLSRSQVILPAWRVRTEYRPNWDPFTQVLPGATDAERQAFMATGKVATPWTNEGLKPNAVDAPLIHSLLINEADAMGVRDRAALAWGRMRSLYDATAYIDDPELYETVGVNYDPSGNGVNIVSGNFRQHGAIRSLGVGPAQLQWWG